MVVIAIAPSGPVLLVILVLGLLAGYFVLRRQMRAEIAELRKLVEAGNRVECISPVPATPKAESALAASPKKQVPPPAPAPVKLEPVKEELTPEILAIIAAAVAQFVGAGARIRSSRMLSVPEGNAWAQQGRVIIQASHNLAMR